MRGLPYESRFLLALLISVTIETLVLFVMVRIVFKEDKTKFPAALLLFAGILATCATLPYLWFIFPLFLRTKILFVGGGELAVTLVESVIYVFVLRIRFARAVIISIACNASSFLLGLLLS